MAADLAAHGLGSRRRHISARGGAGYRFRRVSGRRRRIASRLRSDAKTFVQLAASTEDHLVVLSLQDVASRLDVMTPDTWQPEPIPGVPDNTDTGIAAIDHYTNEIFLLSSGFDKPPRLLYGHAGGSVREVKSSPSRFGATTWW